MVKSASTDVPRTAATFAIAVTAALFWFSQRTSVPPRPPRRPRPPPWRCTRSASAPDTAPPGWGAATTGDRATSTPQVDSPPADRRAAVPCIRYTDSAYVGHRSSSPCSNPSSSRFINVHLHQGNLNFNLWPSATALLIV